MKIFCVGLASYDITIPVASYPKENSKTLVGKKIECGGGTASNTAVLLSDWGEKTYFIGSIGNDYYGRKVLDSFFLHSVNTKYLNVVDHYHTPTTNIIINCEKGTRTSFIFKDQNLDYKQHKFLFNQPDVIFFDGNFFSTAISLINKNKKAIKILTNNTDYKKVASLAPYMDYVIISDEVARKLSKIKFKSGDKTAIKEAYKVLEGKLKTQIIITLEELGSFSKVNGLYQIIPSLKVRVSDSTAAGDIYAGAFTYFISHGYSLKKSMYLSNVAGAISTTRIGGRFSIPSKEEILSYDK